MKIIFEKKRKILGILLFIFMLNFVFAASILDELHLNIQTTDAGGNVVTGTFDFDFNISTTSDCNNVIYSDSATLTTDSRGIISYYLTGVNMDYANQYYLCYYRDDVLINNSKISRSPYAFRAKYVNTSGIEVDSNLDLSGFNFTSDYIFGDGSGLSNLNVSNIDLSDYVPYTGADKNLVLGDNNFSVGGSDFFVDADSGNVGIGTVSSDYPLEVVGNTSLTSDYIARIFDQGTGYSRPVFQLETLGSAARMQFKTPSHYWNWYLGAGGEMRFDSDSGTSKLSIESNSKQYSLYANSVGTGIGTNSVNNALTVNGSADFSGNVGINTTTPQNKLNVIGDINATGYIIGDGSQLTNLNVSNIDLSDYVPYTGANQNLVLGDNNFSVGGSDLFVNSNTGFVGIGTSTPSYKLDVMGTTSNDAIKTDIGLDINRVGPPATCGGTPQSGSGLEVGEYYYRISYITDLGESTPKLSSLITTTTGNQQILLTLPVSSDTRVIGRKIYRTLVGGPSYYMGTVTTINNNVDTSYVDSMPDSSLTNVGYESYYKVDTTTNYITVSGTKAMTLDSQKTSFGFGAGDIGAGGENVYVGKSAGSNTGSGSRQTFIGSNAGASATGTNVVMVGTNAGYTSTGNSNVILGSYAGSNLIGSDSVFIGVHTGYTSSKFITGSGNVVIGRQALNNYNDDFSGSNNVFIGKYAGKVDYGQVPTTSNSIALGYKAYTTKSNQVVLGNIDVVETLLRGNVGLGTTTPQNALNVIGDGNFTGNVYGSFIGDGSQLSNLNLSGVNGSTQWLENGNDIYYNDGNVGIGTTTPQNTLNVVGDINVTSSEVSMFFEGTALVIEG